MALHRFGNDFSEISRRQPCDPLKYAREVALIGETGFDPHLSEVDFRVGEFLTGKLHADAPEVVPDRLAVKSPFYQNRRASLLAAQRGIWESFVAAINRITRPEHA